MERVGYFLFIFWFQDSVGGFRTISSYLETTKSGAGAGFRANTCIPTEHRPPPCGLFFFFLLVNQATAMWSYISLAARRTTYKRDAGDRTRENSYYHLLLMKIVERARPRHILLESWINRVCLVTLRAPSMNHMTWSELRAF